MITVIMKVKGSIKPDVLLYINSPSTTATRSIPVLSDAMDIKGNVVGASVCVQELPPIVISNEHNKYDNDSNKNTKNNTNGNNCIGESTLKNIFHKWLDEKLLDIVFCIRICHG
jgi:hypothetical protein